MAKTVRMREIVEKVSELYRDERGKISDLSDELNTICLELNRHETDGGKNITVAEYERLKMRKHTLMQNKKSHEKYCEGIFEARELLMDLGFDTIVDMDEHIKE